MKKRNLLNKMLALAMSLCMIFTMMPMAAHATESEHSHSWNSVWQADEISHWHECSADGCTITADSEKDSYSAHDFSDYPERCSVCSYITSGHTHSGGEATCIWRATCAGCGSIYGETDPNNHNDYLGSANNGDGVTHTAKCSCGYVYDAAEAHIFSEWTDNGDGTRGRFCVRCYHDQTENVEVEHTHSYGDWNSNGNGTHSRTCSENDDTQTENCSGGTATCNAHATCSYCGATYGSLNSTNHSGGTEIRDAKDATDTEAGYTGDTYCLGCGDKLSDGETIPATGDGDDDDNTHTHSYTAVVTAPTCIDRGYTTYTCSCNDSYVGDYVDALGCTWGDYIPDGDGYHTRTCTTDTSHFQNENCYGGTATCKELATCSECGGNYGNLNSTNHSGGTEVRNAKDATDTEAGYTGDTYCKGCGVKLSEGDTIPATGGGDDDDYHTHNYSYYKYDGTNHWKMCICGQGQAGSVKPHTLVIQSNNNGHWKECTVCNYYSDIQAHVYSSDSDESCNDCGYNRHVHSFSTATCAAPATCSCGRTFGFTDSNNHTGGTEIRNAAEPTIVAEGYTGDTYCLGCGSMIVSGEVIPKAGVIFDGPGVEDVTFIPAEGTELPEDVKIIVNPHTPSADDLDFVSLPETVKLSTRMAVVTEDMIVSMDATIIGPDGGSYTQHEKLLIHGKEYYVSGSGDGGSLLLYDKEGNIYSYDGRKVRREIGRNAGAEYPENKFISINGAIYQIHSVLRDTDGNGTLILYLDGKPAGMCQFNQFEEMDSINIYNDDYHPAKVRERQQLNNYLGTVTTGETPIDGLESGKTYNVSVVGSQDISVPGYDEAVLNSIKAETEAEKAAREKVERLKADMEAKEAAMDQLWIETGHLDYWYAVIALEDAEAAYEAALAELAALANLQSATVTQTFDIPNELVGRTDVTFAAVHNTNPFPVPGSSIRDDIANFIEEWHKQWEETYSPEIGTVEVSEDGQTLTATYTVSSFSPFTVYAFVEADEPEIKTLSATIVDGSDDTTEAPDTSEPVVSPQTSDIWIWYVLVAVVAGAIAVASVVYGKRRKSKAN